MGRCPVFLECERDAVLPQINQKLQHPFHHSLKGLFTAKLKMGRVFSMFPSRSNVSCGQGTHNLLLLSYLSSTFVIWTSTKERDSVSSKPRVCLLPSKTEYCLLAEEDPCTLLVWCKPVEITVSTQALLQHPWNLSIRQQRLSIKPVLIVPQCHFWAPITMCSQDVKSIC